VSFLYTIEELRRGLCRDGANLALGSTRTSCGLRVSSLFTELARRTEEAERDLKQLLAEIRSENQAKPLFLLRYTRLTFDSSDNSIVNSNNLRLTFYPFIEKAVGKNHRFYADAAF
jgi:hypothetical protein